MNFGNEPNEKTFLHFEVSDSFTNQVDSHSVILEEAGLGWPVLLQEYIRFLEKFYGYEFLDQVAIRRNPVRVKCGWKGEYFGVATDQEISILRELEEFDEKQMKLFDDDERDSA